ncbi:MAG TPA: hypothetical protein VGJ82_21390 [Thermoanaerobaculia bacterium]|jgi:hypothetical protein
MAAPSNILTFLETVGRGTSAETASPSPSRSPSSSQPVDSNTVHRIIGVLSAQPDIEVGRLQQVAEVDIFELGPALKRLVSLGAIEMVGTGSAQKVMRGPNWDSLISVLT